MNILQFANSLYDEYMRVGNIDIAKRKYAIQNKEFLRLKKQTSEMMNKKIDLKRKTTSCMQFISPGNYTEEQEEEFAIIQEKRLREFIN